MGRKPSQARLTDAEIARRYRDGETLTAVAFAAGLSASAAYGRLKRAGAVPRPGAVAREYRAARTAHGRGPRPVPGRRELQRHRPHAGDLRPDGPQPAG